ncbi:RS3A [Hepatospora eriocheir]|uniref:RS3A n=1 Tax=Hepatospora eriocheir TaxID=1081669 RepID=A0A1X0Q846_9MICR|nr:RS3A [Hepatospora eriocheir]
MAIRAAGTYVSKSKGSRKSKKKESSISKDRFYNLTTNYFPQKFHGQTSHPKLKAKQDIDQFLMGRTFFVNQADLDSKESVYTNSPRNFHFKVNDISGNNCNSVFNGMTATKEKITSMIRKNHTLIEVNTTITLKDQSIFRVFVNAVTKKTSTSLRHYAKTSETKKIRAVIEEIIKSNCDGLEVSKLVSLLSTESLAREMEKKCESIYPINALIHKVKPIKNVACIIKSVVKDTAVENSA